MVAEPKDIILAVLGASVAIAGLLLVFTGFLFTQAASFPATTPDAITENFRAGVRVGIIPFLAALADSVVSFLWLLWPGTFLYQTAIIGFLAVLVGTATYGAVTILYFLRG
jgi:hypothetical protein